MKQRVALYLRLSKEDLEKNISLSVSESIKNQELMLKEEVQKHPSWNIVGIYADEDYSGAGTYRPAFERLIQDCENKKIDIVLCKSQSRFSRDMEIIEKYLHNKFLEWNIRFISLVDNADTTILGNKKSRQINALVNEWFLEDLSNNIKSTFRTKWRNGECTSAFAKYGLRKDPKNKNHLLIDPIASQVLQEIANLFLKGYGPGTIAKILEQKNILSPYEYKRQQGCKLKIPASNQTLLNKKGKYIMEIRIQNSYPKKLENTTLFLTFKTDDSNAKILVESIFQPENLKIYYPRQSSLYQTNPIKSSWVPLKEEEQISTNEIILQIDSMNGFSESYLELQLEISNIHQKQTYYPHYQVMNQKKDFILFSYEIRKKCQWSGRMISYLLKEEAYHGKLIQGKSKRISYKNHKCIQNEKENWICRENVIEKIFDDTTWNAIQKKIKQKNRSDKNGKNYPFAGKVYCDICGNRMYKNSSSIKKKEKREYLICKDRKTHWKNCDNHISIPIEKLKDIVLTSFQRLFQSLYDENFLKMYYQKNLLKQEYQSQLETLKKEKKKIFSIIQKKDSSFYELYKDKEEGLIDNQDFTLLRKSYKEEKEKYQRQLNQIEEEIARIKKKKESKETIFSLEKKIFSKIDFSFVNIFIEQIRIGKVDQNLNRTIIIFWNF